MSVRCLKGVILSTSIIMCTSILPANAEDYFTHLRYLLSAEFNWYLQKKEEALKDMDECIKASSRNAGAYSLRASMRGDIGNYEGALDDCNVALYLKPNLKSALRMRAAAKVGLEDYKGGIADLTRLIKNDSGDVELYLARCDAYMQAKNEAMARMDLDKALQLNPQNNRTKMALITFYLRFNKYEQGLKVAEKLVADAPKLSDSYFFRARAYAALGQNQKAISDYTQSIKLDPKDSTGYTNRGFEKLIIKDYKGSLEDSKTSMTINPKSPYPVTNTALVYFLQGNYLQAAEWYKKAAQMWNTNERRVRIHVYSALCYRLAGREKEAQSEIAIANSAAGKTNLGAIISFLQGKGTDTSVMLVSSANEYQTVARVILGTELLRLKKTKEGSEYLNWVASNGSNREDERYMAKSQLERRASP